MFQRRGDYENPGDFFNRSHVEYEEGFGDERGEFWLGLGTMRMLTRQGRDEDTFCGKTLKRLVNNANVYCSDSAPFCI